MFADYALDRYIQMGIPPHIAAGIVGAFQQESGMDLDPEAVHDNGTGFGIAGWRDPQPGVGRKTELMNWAKQSGQDPSDIDTQLDYFLWEITDGPEKAVGDKLFSAQNVDEAADAMVHYERPQGYDQNDVTKANGYENRLNNARSLFNTYTGGNLATPQEEAPLPDLNSDDPKYNPELEELTPQDDDYYEPEEGEDEGPTDMERAGKAVYAAGQRLRDQASEPLDYTPGGDNMEVEVPQNSGIPVDAYQQFTSLYADGGVVGENDIDEFFKSLGV